MLVDPRTPATAPCPHRDRYAKCSEASKRMRWGVESDVLRERNLDFTKTFLPDGLTLVSDLPFLTGAEACLLSHVQGRTYASMLALLERSVGAKTLEITRAYWLADQVTLEALLRFADEEREHQAMFRRLERMAAAGMPPGYAFVAERSAVADAVLGKSRWAALGLTLHIELFSQAHYRATVEPDASLSELWADVLLFHWMEESQHAIMDELEWRLEHARLTEREREQGVRDLLDLVVAIDRLVQAQGKADADYFIGCAACVYTPAQQAAIRDVLLRAYRWQYIVMGLREPRFDEALRALTTAAQRKRIDHALAPIVEHVAR